MNSVEWNGYTIVEVNDKKVEEMFCGVYVHGEHDYTPSEVKGLKEGYYKIVEENQYFMVGEYYSDYSKENIRSYKFILREKNVLLDELDRLSEREEQEKLAEVMSEVIIFENDLANELVFIDGKAKLKNYYNKNIELVVWEDLDDNYTLYVDGKEEVDIVSNTKEDGTYSAYDGVTGYGWYSNIKGAIKSYMDNNFRYDTDEEYYEPNCTNCGDGGCFYCEPHRFI